jgi:hemoglobin-like flavoprotein
MTPQQIALVQSSYSRLGPEKARVGVNLLARLFAADPQARGLFKNNANHAPIFNGALQLVVKGLSDTESLLPMVSALGCRHAIYGVEARHYAAAGGALVGALDDVMGPDFTPEVRDAWIAAYGLLSATMQAAGDSWQASARMAAELDGAVAKRAAA